MATTHVKVNQPAARCKSCHPYHKAQVVCEERGGHDMHFNSFFMRSWSEDDVIESREVTS